MTTDKQSATFSDELLGFAIPTRNSRGRAVRLGPVLEDILSAHDYPQALKHVLAEALVLTTLMGGLLKGDGDQLTMQAQGEGGVISLLVCDYRDGEIRGYVQQAQPEDPAVAANPSLETLFGKAHLAITFDIAKTGKRYQGIVPLEGQSLSGAVEVYFARSEQVPTLIRSAIRSGKQGTVAAGFLVQHLPDGEEGRERLHVRMDHPEWEHVSIMAESLRHEELVEESLSLEEIVWRLYHEEQRVLISPGARLSKGCRCTEAHFEEVLARFPKEDRREMANDEGIILVDCAFCSKVFPIQD
ncbi:Hsp33 family molecular chaperone HslO [Aurantiacibacter sp. MUD11]|uniref:Hsp33 family molecular chaperone HslO n=1 Tax=Aurantiacibacter sp. MUD11 TaxID=3003265 RepID=UPI0022AB0696|nr:Hsp33 family molecular chaperone HslO [Aurantiacibacter sp. MUD11]WAT17322.1 Hsp33 family molecular chaperone HslO [Aurantiacibacter sp. MUD11]